MNHSQQSARAEWLRVKKEADAEARAFRKRMRAKRKPLAECAPLFQATKEMQIGLAEIKRNAKRAEER